MSAKTVNLSSPYTLRRSLKSLYMAVPFKRQFFSMVKKFWVPPLSIHRYLYFKDRFRVEVGDTSFLINHYGYDIETSIFWTGLTGSWERKSMELWLKLCKRSNVILDVGANTGIYSLAAKTVNAQACIYSFEPVPRVFEKLVANNSLNGYEIRCQQIALSNYDGEGIIYDLPTEHIYSVTVNKNLHAAHLPVKETKIQVKKLATFIEEERLGAIDLIKIDVETHEPQVLAGLERYLELMKPTILLEVWNDEVGEKVEAVLRGHNYLYFSTDEKSPFVRQEHIRNPHPERGYLSYLICQEPLAADLFLLMEG